MVNRPASTAPVPPIPIRHNATDNRPYPAHLIQLRLHTAFLSDFSPPTPFRFFPDSRVPTRKIVPEKFPFRWLFPSRGSLTTSIMSRLIARWTMPRFMADVSDQSWRTPDQYCLTFHTSCHSLATLIYSCLTQSYMYITWKYPMIPISAPKSVVVKISEGDSYGSVNYHQ